MMKVYQVKTLLAVIVTTLLVSLVTTLPAKHTPPRLSDSYIIVWGEFGAANYLTIQHLCISDIRTISKGCSELANRPSFVNAFDQEVIAMYPKASNQYISGYKSYYKCFQDRDEASAYRRSMINKAAKVDQFSW